MVDGGLLRARVDVLPRRPVPGLRAARRSVGRRGHLLRRLDPVHRRRRAAELARLVGPALRRRLVGLVGRDRPVGGHALLQRHDLPGDAHVPDQFRLRQARLAAGLARLDLLPRLGRDRLPRVGAPWLVADPRRRGLVAAGGQPARLRLLRHLGRRRLRRPGNGLDARPSRGELEHLGRRGLLPGVRPRLAQGPLAGCDVSSTRFRCTSVKSRPSDGRTTTTAIPKTISSTLSVSLGAAASATVTLGGSRSGCCATAQPQPPDATAPAASTRAPRSAPRRSRTSTASPHTTEISTSARPSLFRPSKTSRASRWSMNSPTAASAPVTTAATTARAVK